jgi:hypothetical protein
VERVKRIVGFFTGHSAARRALTAAKERVPNPPGQLKRYARTRFLSAFYMVEAFAGNFDFLQVALWNIAEDTPLGDREQKETAKLFKSIMNEHAFRRGCELLIVVMKPIVIALRATDRKSLNMWSVVRDFYEARRSSIAAVEEYMHSWPRRTRTTCSRRVMRNVQAYLLLNCNFVRR